MSEGESFDVFLSHNSHDKPAVRALKERLEAHRIKCWFDEDQLRPGIPWQELLEDGIKVSSSVAVLVGSDGLGPWETEEMRAALQLAVRDKRPVIPVLLPDAPSKPDLPLFLSNRTWVEFRDAKGSNALDQLVWGITGTKPKAAHETTDGLFMVPFPRHNCFKGREDVLENLREDSDEDEEPTPPPDSPAYAPQAKEPRWIARHPGVLYLVVIAVSVLIGWYTVSWFVFQATDINDWYEGALAGAFPTGFPGSAFENVRIVAFDEDTDFEALAAREGIDGMLNSRPLSLRRIHGKLMSRLAESKCQAVAFDISFGEPSEFDDEFVQGVSALREQGIDVTVGAKRWWFDEPITALVSEDILPHVYYGCTVVRLLDTPYAVQLAAQRGVTHWLPSFPLAIYATYEHPGHEFDYLVDDDADYLDLVSYVRPSAAPAERVDIETAQIPLTRATLGLVNQGRFKDAFDPRWGLGLTDLLAFVYFDIPSDRYLAASTVRYEKVFDATSDELRGWFEGKAVLIADQRRVDEAAGFVDRYVLPDKRSMSGCYAHASVLDQLIRNDLVRMIHPVYELLLLIVSAALGAAAAALPFTRDLKFQVAVAVMSLLLIGGASMCVYAWWRFLFNPIVPFACLVIAFVLCAWFERVHATYGVP